MLFLLSTDFSTNDGQHLSVWAITPGSSQKVNEVCSVCYVSKQLHLKYGNVHLHGLRSNICQGSHKPPQPDHQTALSKTTLKTTQPVQQHQSGRNESRSSQSTHSEYNAPASNDDIQPNPTSFTDHANYPSLQSKLLSHTKRS